MMSNKEISLELVKEATTNPASNAAFLVLGTRKRDRTTLTLSSLYLVMKKKGFNYKRDEYVGVLRLLDRLGLAQLDFNRNHRVVGIKNIRVRLTSIGRVAFNKVGDLDAKPPARRAWRPRPKVLAPVVPKLPTNDVVDLPPPISREKMWASPVVVEAKPELKVVPIPDHSLTLYINGKPLTITIPRDFTPEDIGHLVTKIYRD